MDADSASARRAHLLDGMQELFLSANIACALGYALSFYISHNAILEPPQNDSSYYFLRGAVRVNDLLHLGATSAVSTEAVARRDSIIWNHLAIATTFVVTICAATALLLLLVRAFGIRSRYPSAFRRAAALVALFAAPSGHVLVLLATWNWPSGLDMVSPSPDHSLQTFLVSALIAEVTGLAALFAIRRKRGLSRTASVFFLLLHSAFWGAFLFSALPVYLREARILYLVHVALWLAPSAGAALLLYVWPTASASRDSETTNRIRKWTLIPAALGVIALLVIWMPHRDHSPSQPKDLQSAVIELSRGYCFGSCPVYMIRLHGDGDMEFIGKQSVRVEGTQTAKLSPGQFLQAMEILNRAHFASLDDRAFSWCFDTPTVSVAVSMDGYSKLVSSDAGCVGAKSGVQARFVQATEDFEKLVGTERWVRCEGHRCR